MVLEKGKNDHPTASERAAEMKPCPTGRGGACCSTCALGPCRLTGGWAAGVCGANLNTVAAREFARMVAAGAAAHSDHGRELAVILRELALGRAGDYRISDVDKLRRVAGLLGLEADGEVVEIALRVAEAVLSEYGRQEGTSAYLRRAPRQRRNVWIRTGITPRGIDREVVETLHRTVMGNDQHAEHLLDQALRTALASGWGGSMLTTDLTDILFGTPRPRLTFAGLGVLEEKQVNILVHGHEPLLAEMIVAAALDPELLSRARSLGADGINVAGICCTANELLARRGIPSAGSFPDQEPALATGTVEMMVVDVQCVFQSLAALAEKFHTIFVTTSPKAKIQGAIHREFHPNRALDLAKELVGGACDNFANRRDVRCPAEKRRLVAGYSHEFIETQTFGTWDMFGGTFQASLRHLNDSIIEGHIVGVAAVVGCESVRHPRGGPDGSVWPVVGELIRRNILVIVTGCAAISCGKNGHLDPKTLREACPDLAEFCAGAGIAPVLHLGSCVDNSRILTLLSGMVEAGGLGTDISDLPVAAACPEWVSEKALEIATYCAASGFSVFCGTPDPLAAAPGVTGIMAGKWPERFGGQLVFCDPAEIAGRMVAVIEAKRSSLGISLKGKPKPRTQESSVP